MGDECPEEELTRSIRGGVFCLLGSRCSPVDEEEEDEEELVKSITLMLWIRGRGRPIWLLFGNDWESISIEESDEDVPGLVSTWTEDPEEEEETEGDLLPCCMDELAGSGRESGRRRLGMGDKLGLDPYSDL